MVDPEGPDFVRPRVRLDGPIHLAPADPDWPLLYHEQERRIRSALGRGRTRSSVEIQMHLFPVGCLEVDGMLLFRDRLRADPKERTRYEDTKWELAARHSALRQVCGAYIRRSGGCIARPTRKG